MTTQLKDPNPKDVAGIRKAPMSTVSGRVLLEVGLAMLEGARKYGRHNWRATPVVASVYYDATFRHILDWWEGKDVDPDSGLNHLAKALADLHILRDAEFHGTLIDDRPCGNHCGVDLTDLNALAGKIVSRYSDSKPPFCRN